MLIMRVLLVTLISFMAFVPNLISAEKSTKELLSELDATIDKRAQFAQIREGRIKNYKNLCALSQDKRQKYHFYGRLLDEYRNYNADSAFRYAQLKLMIAESLKNDTLLCDSHLNMADIYSLIGMFKEALEEISQIREESVPTYLKPYFCHVLKNTYGLMEGYSIDKDKKIKYRKIVDHYRNRLLEVIPKNQIEHFVILSDKYIYEKNYDAALKLMDKKMKELKPGDHNIAFFAFSYSVLYEAKGDKDKQIRYLAISSISDLQSAVKEYVSLRELAMVLYKEGDIDRAYKYLKCSMEDAKDCNARLRTVQISTVFPIIDDAYNAKNQAQKRQILMALIGISFLSLILIIAVIVVYKQMKKLAIARKNLHQANNELSELNEKLIGVNVELNDTNTKLLDTNEKLQETSIIKEEYIGRYMDQCSTYIEKLELYRKSLYKIVASKNMEKLVETVKSTKVIDDELKDFYHNFDDTFLRLFPNFVEHFNALINENGCIYPKMIGELNTELRIYALIRLGITDSVKIAQFLRYSVTTIYNYRTRIRNKAIGERDEFEDKVMQIGKIEK